MKEQLISAWRYRHFIVSSIQSEFRSRFVRSRLGGLWMIIHPLAQALIFALVLGKLMAAKLPGMTDMKFAYPIYLMSGMLAWSLFTEVITSCLTLFIAKGDLLKKIVFPRICLPLIVAGSSFLNNLLLFLAIVGVFAMLGHPPGIQLVWILPLIVITLALALGIGLILGVLNVFIRDIGQVVPIVLQLGFWVTPIVYISDILPVAIRSYLPFNPMAILVEQYQNIMLFNQSLYFLPLCYPILLTAFLLLGGFFLFRRANSEIVDVL